jgi:hypothetical protein
MTKLPATAHDRRDVAVTTLLFGIAAAGVAVAIEAFRYLGGLDFLAGRLTIRPIEGEWDLDAGDPVF